MGNNDDSTDFAYLLVLGFIAFGAYRVWDQRLRPWLSEQWDRVTEVTGTSVSADQLDGLAADAVVVAIILLPVLVLLYLLRRAMRRRRRDRTQAKEEMTA